jgi:DNA polymerase V
MSGNFTVINGGKNGISAPAVPDTDERLDLNRYLVRHPAATFFVRVSGDSMTGAGINSGDILIVDRAVEHQSGDIIIALVGDELTVKRLRVESGVTWLDPENPADESRQIEPDDDFEVFGVVTFTIHAPNSKTGVSGERPASGDN